MFDPFMNIIAIDDLIINLDELLYIKKVKERSLYVACFKKLATPNDSSDAQDNKLFLDKKQFKSLKSVITEFAKPI